MPNWCVTNWRIQGDPETVKSFCDTVNDLPNRLDAMENGFGKFFLGNLAAALGLDLDRLSNNIRGTIDCDPELFATLCFPESEEQKPLVPELLDDGDATVAFSTSSAWDMPYWLEDYFVEKELDYGYYKTDEFGNFHCVHNTEMFPYIYAVSGNIDYEEFKDGEENELLDYIHGHTGIEFTCVGNYEEFVKALDEHQQELDEKEIHVEVYEIE